VTYDASERACVGVCGDGLRRGYGEECDDNNTISGDGCSSTCKLEQGFRCEGINPDICEAVAPPQAYLEYKERDYSRVIIKFTRALISDNLCDVNLKFNKIQDQFLYKIDANLETLTCNITIEPLVIVSDEVLTITFNNPMDLKDQFGFTLAASSHTLTAYYSGYLIND